MLNAYKHQHMIVRNFNARTLTRTFFPSLLFLFSTFSFFGIFMFRHFYFRPKLGLPDVFLPEIESESNCRIIRFDSIRFSRIELNRILNLKKWTESNRV